jgi:hypothetical protein
MRKLIMQVLANITTGLVKNNKTGYSNKDRMHYNSPMLKQD